MFIKPIGNVNRNDLTKLGRVKNALEMLINYFTLKRGNNESGLRISIC